MEEAVVVVLEVCIPNGIWHLFYNEWMCKGRGKVETFAYVMACCKRYRHLRKGTLVE